MLSGEDLEPLYQKWDEENRKAREKNPMRVYMTPVFDAEAHWKVEGEICRSGGAYWFFSACEADIYGPYASLVEARQAFKWYCEEFL